MSKPLDSRFGLRIYEITSRLPEEETDSSASDIGENALYQSINRIALSDIKLNIHRNEIQLGFVNYAQVCRVKS
ncbi:hypothetical protein OK016_07015 [Vibrio chagasii]|nr:hypothetical protein [Vibrio chagasii]